MATSLTSAADRRRPTLWDGAVALCILLLAGLALLLFSPSHEAGDTAVVRLNGQEVARLPLSRPGSYPLNTPYPITLTVEDGAVRVSEAGCPGEDCLHIGAISQQGQTIVCLPNRLVISISGTNSSGIDAVTG